ncbi:tRNA (adenosine(37)-N6)-threonylcarbamoyltransferase complex dimerization subunit type 1 TsaB [Sphingomicrobium lutaoense]|uniref:tRNA threonylcarbamoyl adenosine modification protein YeaZ n=1 Tax=Sphingomicrobium lutaoense TaxID=515949 RepID=A0A839YSH5_9SPHN|nr:tRNA (adenosine(37)-N6)-threonylcarbamoyltransferase complex dimerization subunit type 1 TsaB [Sphingomicrobium lutaoense]MBB3763241.1 tRNA threonylcarbamoyl adenosine modification protein YeaZ [Sphingomicrobium lutaoense]
MILAIDTSTAACSVALFGANERLMAREQEVIGRGHAERLVPMIEKLLDGRQPDAILVGVGPGSFTGIRVGIAAAQGLAIGWNIPLDGMSSLALIAASAGEEPGARAAVVPGGHGELFVQEFDGPDLTQLGPHRSLAPEAAAEEIGAPLLLGPGAATLIAARGSGEAREGWPDAGCALDLPEDLRKLAPKPLYGRPPDAKPKAAV